jgi:hypothetical protein
METKITNKDNFLSKMKQKYEVGGKENEALKSKATTMAEILEGNVMPPEKLHVAGPVGETSVKKDGPNHNPLHGGEGKDMMKKED